ncbi:MAG: hypothetical protein V1760_02530 [Candidatus Peregrinibacteria bacterium]
MSEVTPLFPSGSCPSHSPEQIDRARELLVEGLRADVNEVFCVDDFQPTALPPGVTNTPDKVHFAFQYLLALQNRKVYVIWFEAFEGRPNFQLLRYSEAADRQIRIVKLKEEEKRISPGGSNVVPLRKPRQRF